MSDIVKYFEGNQVRMYQDNDEARTLWFDGRDVAERLGYDKASNMYQLLDADEMRRETYLDTNAGNSSFGAIPRTYIQISEPGLYKLIARSNKPEAKSFDRWVRHEVLPEIRRTGSYSVFNGTDERGLLARALAGVGDMLKSLAGTAETHTADIADLKADVNKLKDQAEADARTFTFRQRVVALGYKPTPQNMKEPATAAQWAYVNAYKRNAPRVAQGRFYVYLYPYEFLETLDAIIHAAYRSAQED